MRQPQYQSLDYTDEDLDRIYDDLSRVIKDEVDERTGAALERQGINNTRPGSQTWLKVRRKALMSLLCEAEDRERDSELGD